MAEERNGQGPSGPVDGAGQAPEPDRTHERWDPTTAVGEDTRSQAITRTKEESPIRPGVTVDHYGVIRPLGRGGMGQVFLARDHKLGRRIALKVLEPRRIGTPGAVERLISEARATARFSHPHIVTIHAVGEFEGHPYLALEYLEGQSLAERLGERRLGEMEIVRIGLAIAEALEEAHRHRILHRDLKPANVMIPTDGRLRVLDFGLARTLQLDEPEIQVSPVDSGGFHAFATASETGTICGTPAYMSPEQWGAELLGAPSDIWALGMILYEALRGEHPYSGWPSLRICWDVTCGEPLPPLASDTPAPLRGLVQRCLERAPKSRPAAAEVTTVLRDLLGNSRPSGDEDRSPFRGLLPFGERHADRFFGREPEIAAALERLRVEPLLPIVGPSGAGKSSFVQAGLIPRLREQGRWRVLQLRPGPFPLRSLAIRLLQRGGTRSSMSTSYGGGSGLSSGSGGPDQQQIELEEHQLREELRSSPMSLALRLLRLAEGEQARVLLFVDQLEELHTLTEDEEDTRLYMDALCQAADDPQGPVRVVFTLRDDFLGRLARGRAAREALGSGLVLASPGPDALTEILTRPVRAAGYAWEDKALVPDMVTAVQGEQAALPLLQFTCQALWERRDRSRRLLQRDAYREVGGVAGALAHHADGLLASLPTRQVHTARTLLLRLITPEATRKVVARGRLLEGLSPEASEVLDRLIRERVLVARKTRGRRRTATGGSHEADIELVHESLIRSWRRLARWLDEGREEIAFIEEVEQAAELWTRRGLRGEELWQGEALQEALRRASLVPDAPELVRRFLSTAETRERRRSVRRRLLLALGFALTCAVALVMALQTGQARKERRRAELRAAEVQREGARAAVARGDRLEARARLRDSLEIQDSTLARTLWWQLRRDPLVWTLDAGGIVYDVDISPAGDRVAAGCRDRAIRLVEDATGEVTVLRGHDDQVLAVEFSSDGTMLASGGIDGQIGLWDLVSGTSRLFASGARSVGDVDFSPDGSRLAATGPDATVVVWHVATLRQLVSLEGHERSVTRVRWGADGRTLASAGRDATVRLWDGLTGEAKGVLRGHTDQVVGLDFSPDGRLVASGSWDNTIRVWDVETRLQVRLITRTNPNLYPRSVVFSPNGRLLATASNEGAVRVWDLETAEEVRALPGHTDRIRGVDLGPGGIVASGAFDHSIRRWNLGAPDEAGRQRGHGSSVYSAVFHPDGELLATGSMDGIIRLWDSRTGDQVGQLAGHKGTVETLDFSPDGTLLASGGLDFSTRLWELSTGRQVRQVQGHEAGVFHLAFSPNGGLLATASGDGSVRVWDVRTGVERLALAVDASQGGLVFEAGNLSAATQGGPIGTWALPSGQPTGRIQPEDPSGATSLRRSKDGRWLAWIASDEVVVQDRRSGATRSWTPPQRWTRSIDLSPTGEVVGVTATGGGAWLWEPASGSVTPLEGHHGSVTLIRFSPDGLLATTVGHDGSVRLWTVPDGRPAWFTRLHSAAARLSHLGWDGGTGDPTAWRTAVQEARLAALSDDGATLCLVRGTEDVELWDPSGDRLLVGAAVAGASRLWAQHGHCVVRGSGERVLRLAANGELSVVATDVDALWADSDHLVVASGGELSVLGSEAGQAAPLSLDAGVTAVADLGDRLAVGYREGGVELVTRDGSVRTPLDGVPSSTVVALLGGPAGTIAAGYASGDLALWALESGALLYRTRLHGPLVHLALDGDRLLAATELGDSEELELGELARDYCEFMEELWAEVPTVWEGGRPVVRPPPSRHPCSPR